MITIGITVFVEKKAPADNNPRISVSTSTEPIVSTSTESIISEIDTSIWETYVNTKWGYKFKYPENWYIDEATERITRILPYGIETKLYIKEISKVITITVYIDKEELPRPYFPPSIDKIETKGTTVGGMKAEEDLLINLTGRWAGTTKWVLVEKDGRFYKFIVDMENAQTIEVFNQILKTFEFIE